MNSSHHRVCFAFSSLIGFVNRHLFRVLQDTKLSYTRVNKLSHLVAFNIVVLGIKTF